MENPGAAPPDTELPVTFEGVITYSDAYKVDEPERYVIPGRVEIDEAPKLSGTNRKHYVTLSRNRFVLRPSTLPKRYPRVDHRSERVRTNEPTQLTHLNS